MKITKVEAVRLWSERLIRGIAPNWMWVRLHTDKGLAGTGESHPGSDAHRGALSEVAPSHAWRGCQENRSPVAGHVLPHLLAVVGRRRFSHAQARAQRNLLGQSLRPSPVYKLLGGKVQEKFMVYLPATAARYYRERTEKVPSRLVNMGRPTANRSDAGYAAK